MRGSEITLSVTVASLESSSPSLHSNSYGRLYSIMRIFLILFSVHVSLAAISLILNIDFFLNKNAAIKDMQFIEAGLSATNLKSFPLHIFTGTAFFIRSFFAR